MSRIDGSTGASSASSSTGTSSSGSSATDSNGLSNIDMDSFLKLLISEMQNQDPLNPMDNAQMIQQISQIREIGATNQLTDTLSTLSSSQQMVTASGLIGREITGLGSAGDVTGVVDRVTVEVDEDDKNLRTVKVHVGEQTIDMNNIRQINSA